MPSHGTSLQRWNEMHRVIPELCLIAAILTSCFTPATTTSNPTATIAFEPTMTSSPSAPPFIILAYATEGINADMIPYEQLTHLNYAFLTPRVDGSFHPIHNPWKLKQIVSDARAHSVQISISVGGWGWDAQFEELASKAESRTAFVEN